MLTAKLRKSGNSYIVTVPRKEVERLRLREGQTVALEVRALDVRPTLDPALEESVERVWKYNEAGLRYLAGR
jgi:antitoxin component of MazEF toxin-antitoxin module